jgi:hypothetical protein
MSERDDLRKLIDDLAVLRGHVRQAPASSPAAQAKRHAVSQRGRALDTAVVREEEGNPAFNGWIDRTDGAGRWTPAVMAHRQQPVAC